MIAKVVKRLIETLTRVGIIKSYTSMIYDEELFSLNDLYSSGHWRTRSQLKKKYREIFGEFIRKHKLDYTDNFSLVIFYNSRHDCDNITGMEKMFVDALKKEGVIPDDGKRFYKLYCVLGDESLPMNTLNINLINNGS